MKANKQNKKVESDGFLDPDLLKAAEKEESTADPFWDDIAAEQEVQPVRRRFGRNLVLLLATVVFALSIGLFIGARAPQNDDLPLNNPITVVDDVAALQPEGETVGREALVFPAQIGTTAVEIAEGTVTEWLAGSPDNDEVPWFRDMVWHPGMERIYLVAGSSNLYSIDPVTGTIDERDLGLRLNNSSAYFELVAVLDEQRIVIFNDLSDREVIVYNVETDRIETSFGSRGKEGGPGTFHLVSEQGLAVALDQTIYIHHTIQEDGGYVDQVQSFSADGTHLRTFSVERGGDVVAVSPDGTVFTTGYDTIYQYDANGNLLAENERNVFNYIRDIQFDTAGNYYLTRGFDSWFAQVQPDGEIGEVYGPAVDLQADSWELGTFRRPESLVILPDANSFVLLDGSYGFLRIVRLDLNKNLGGSGR